MTELSQRVAGLSPAKRELLQRRLRNQPGVAEPIAIVGMACRFPGAPDLDAFWRLVSEAVDATGEIPPDRWPVDLLYDPDVEAAGKMAVRWGGFVEDVDKFDPMFFGITPREAARMDPQQRLLLEVAWESLENAGLSPQRINGSSSGVFVGISNVDYAKIPAQYEGFLQHIDAHCGTGNAISIAANRLSYILNFRGPSMAVDTACSSALVAVHLAVQSLRRRECNAALAGAVNMILTPDTMIALSKARMLSLDGRCRPFDAEANGYVRGEGCGIVVLKRLSDAVQTGDNILAVIRDSAVNHDGRTSGITAPNGRLQKAVILAALRKAGVSPERVSYVEAHGTGTPLGDPIEVQALAELFPRRSEDQPPCYLSSVKANIGHLEIAAGIASLIKVVLMLQHGRIPPQAHLERLNPHIRLEGTRLRIPRQAVDWPGDGGSRIAGVSSFGFGGTNAHLLVEESGPAAVAPAESDRPLHLLAVSAKTKTALSKLVERYLRYLDVHPQAALPDVCHSANAGRAHFPHRLAVLAENREQLQQQLAAAAEGRRPRLGKAGQANTATRPKVAIVFTGQGSQYVGMGKLLFETQPSFRRTLQQCDEILREHLDESLLSMLYPEPGHSSPLDETAYTQPALFALEYALATLWRSWGISPSMMLGHSVGEYVAACLAGVFGLEDGLRLVAGRARLMQQLPRDGLMAVIFADPQRVGEALQPYPDRLAVAAANGPENTVVSGEAEAVRSLVAEFQRAGTRTQLLPVSHAFHSPLMEPMLEDFQALAATVGYRRPRIPIVSNLTAELISDEPPEADYWCRHVRNTVQFAAGMRRLAEEQPDAVLEVGPAPVLLGMGRRCLPQLESVWLPSLRKGQDDWRVLLNSLAALYVLGVEVDWQGLDRDRPRRRLLLPTYPFERTRHWFEPKEAVHRISSAGRGPMVHPLLGRRVPSAVATRLFEVRLSSLSPGYLIDHQVEGSPVAPGAVYVEQALAAARQTFGPEAHAVESLSLQSAMFFPEGAARTVQVTVSPEVSGQCTFETYSLPAEAEEAEGGWTLHACGKLCHADTQADEEPLSIDLEGVRSRVVDVKTAEEFYDLMASRGLAYGPAFRTMQDLQRTDCDAVAEVRLPEQIRKQCDQYHLHPVLADACFQAMAGVVPLEPDGSYSPFTYMPVSVRRVRMHRELGERICVYVVRTSPGDEPSPDRVEGDVYLLDGQGEVLVEFAGVGVQRLGQASLHEREVNVRDWLYQVKWQPRSIPDSPGPSGPDVRQATSLIFADQQSLGLELAVHLQRQGRRCVMITPGGPFEFSLPAADRPDQGEAYRIDPMSEADYERLFREALSTEAPPCVDIFHCWSLDLELPQDSGERELGEARRLGCGSLLQLVRRLARADLPVRPALWLITQGVHPIGQAGEPISLAQAPLWGMGRVAALEHRELNVRLVDLDPRADAAESASLLAREVEASPEEGQIAFRNGQRYVARLQRAPDAVPGDGEPGGGGPRSLPAHSPFRLRLWKPGSIDSLQFEAFGRRPPGPGQIEIEVHATGLNFSDVLKALGLYPGITDEVVPLGIECSGVVTAVGEGVERFRVGEEVLGVVPYSFASHAVTAEYALVHKPENIDHQEAATISITFLTAYYALRRLGQLQPGERVLIHAGAGGVGLAAIQIAQHVGAEIFATAGSDRKRDFLRSLGVPHVLNSRTLDFADEIMEVTGRRGVDVVLNSLPGDAITKSLSILGAYGRFLEIGKIDIYQNRMIGLLPFQDNLSYSAIDLDRMLRQRPDYIREMFREMMEHFASGAYRPLPLTPFPVEDVLGAFRYMAQRKNIGKVVVSLEDAGSVGQPEERPEEALVRQDGTYLITGGFGALGLRVADWLVGQGAKHVALVSRRPPSPQAAESIEGLRGAGAKVAVIQGDVTDRPSLDDALCRVPAEFPPLRGAVHAAGVLDDGTLFDMDIEQLDRPMAPKVQGAWNLHCATRDAPLDFFVLFSSVASVVGSPGQGNYAAGNAFLDGLAHYRRALGLPALSVNWGPWAESGMAAEAARAKAMAAGGLELLAPEKCLQILGTALRGRATQLAVASVRWRAVLVPGAGDMPSILRDVVPAEDAPGEGGAPESAEDRALRQHLLGMDLSQREEALVGFFREELARIMGMEPSDLDIRQPLNTMGLDSLMAIELRNNMETRLRVVLPMARFMEGPSISKLARYVAEAMGGAGGGASEAVAPTAAETDEHALSRGQQALWFLYRLAPESTAYNIYGTLRVRGPLDLDAVQSAMQTLVDRHAALRTTFHEEDGRPCQRICATWPLKVRLEDTTDCSEKESLRRMVEEVRRAFDLESGPLLRVTLFQRPEDEHLLVFAVHHIVADFWSLVACVDEFQQAYEAARNGRSVELPPLKLQYGDFTRWQAEMLASDEGETHWDYWRGQLAGELPVLDLPTDRPRPPIQTYDGAVVLHELDPELSERIGQLGGKQGATLHTILLAVYQVLLHRYTGQENILVGTPTSGRTRAEFASVVGYFVNPVVIRGDLSGDPPFGAFLGQIQERMYGALDHQDYPFPLLVERLKPRRDPSRSPLFETMFITQRTQIMQEDRLALFLLGDPNARLRMGELTFESLTLEQRSAPFDLTLTTSEVGAGFLLSMQYNTDLFDASTVERMLEHYEGLLRGVVSDPDCRVSELPMLSGPERRRLLVEYNDTQQDYPQDVCLPHLVEAQVRRTPDAVAVAFEGRQLTYRELDGRADQLACCLHGLGVGPETLVAVCMERSLEMVVALLGVLKAGGAYVPVDPSYPRHRIRLMLEDAAAPVVLTHRPARDALPELPAKILSLDSDWEAVAGARTDGSLRGPAADNTAYVIFTSGSTGRPKGVMVSHRAICNHMQWLSRTFPLTESDRLLQKTPFSFDASVWEFYAPLMAGARLVMAKPGGHQDAEYLTRVIAEQGITTLQVVPSVLQVLVETEGLAKCGSLRRVFCGGEPLPGELCERFFARLDAELYNLYGPTETAVDVTCWRCRPGDEGPMVPIGRPVDNTQIYILDAHLQAVPAGVPGELHVGGSQVSKGYLNRPELTSQRFIPDPYGEQPGSRLYKTGDLARFLPDGAIQFLGRIDHQVKLRGFRIELGEIEAVLGRHPAVRQCVVLVREDRAHDQRLVAYVVLRGGAQASREELSAFLRESLPEHMVPSATVFLDGLPLTPGGKVDRRSLPAPDTGRPDMGAGMVPPRNDTESQLTTIWEDVLGVHPVGVTDDFFQLGGHSLLAVRLISRIEQHFDRRLPLSAMYRGHTIERLAEILQSAPAEQAWSPLVAIQPNGSKPPLFLMHPSGGNVLCYHDLAERLGGDRPVYALQARGLEGDLEPHATRNELVAECLEAIRGVQTKGPYHLGGWSAGGIMAYELAGSLRNQGEEVGLVALFDARSPALLRFDPDDEVGILLGLVDFYNRFFGMKVSLSREELAPLEPDARLQRILDRARQAAMTPTETGLEQLRRFVHVAKANLRITTGYTPQRYEMPVHLFVATEETAEREAAGSDLGWREVLGDALAVHRVPGDHVSLLAGENAGRLAELLRECFPRPEREQDAVVESHAPRRR